jgi:hypothetical protein
MKVKRLFRQVQFFSGEMGSGDRWLCPRVCRKAIYASLLGDALMPGEEM